MYEEYLYFIIKIKFNLFIVAHEVLCQEILTRS